jgi:hypothetical protein
MVLINSTKGSLTCLLLAAIFLTGCRVSGPHSNTTFRPLKDEILPPQSIPCFAGAWYRKAVSSFDEWTGISGTIVLGTPTVDEARLNPKTGQPLDNFSVYMGGNAGGKQEVDAGLTWAFTQDALTGKLSERRRAWRPFWRTATWSNAPLSENYSWYPGDTVRMEVSLIAPQKLRLTVADAGARPLKNFSVDFNADSFTQEIKRQFKRVNAIDQFGNEGKPVKPTNANVVNAQWLNTYFMRRGKKVPMNKYRFTDMRCSNALHIVVTSLDALHGAEKIDIFGMPQAN